ncbi:hypothetical protein TWF281_008053 [Arthrobotrys megalospora]
MTTPVPHQSLTTPSLQDARNFMFRALDQEIPFRQLYQNFKAEYSSAAAKDTFWATIVDIRGMGVLLEMYTEEYRKEIEEEEGRAKVEGEMDVDDDEREEEGELGGPSVSFNCVTELSKLKTYRRAGLLGHSGELKGRQRRSFVARRQHIEKSRKEQGKWRNKFKVVTQ